MFGEVKSHNVCIFLHPLVDSVMDQKSLISFALTSVEVSGAVNSDLWSDVR